MPGSTRAVLALAVWALWACTRAQTTPPEVAQRASSTTSSTTGAGAGASAGASDSPAPSTVVRESVLDLVDKKADVVAYLDANAFRNGAQYAALLRLAEGSAQEFFAKVTRTCGFNLLDAPAELAVSYSRLYAAETAEFFVLAARSNFKLEATLQCLTRVYPGLEDYAWLKHPFLILENNPLNAAVARLDPASFKPPAGDYLHVRYTADNPWGAKELVFALAKRAGQNEVRVEALGTADNIDALEQQVRDAWSGVATAQLVPNATPTTQQELFAALLSSVAIEREGERVRVKLVTQPGQDEAAMFSALAAVGAYAYRSYLATTQAAEARGNVFGIAYLLADYAKQQDVPRFPPSATRIPHPARVSAAYQSTPSEWQTPGWQDIGFSISQLQHYTYEFVTTPGAQKVTVRATAIAPGTIPKQLEIDVSVEGGGVFVGALREQPEP